MRRTVEYFAGVGVAACLIASPASAHEQAIGLTEISLAAAEGGGVACLLDVCRLEIAHRYSIHDAESTLMSVLGARPDLVSDPEAQRKFETYVADRFGLSEAETGASVPLKLLGGEVERGYYWVYQEGLLPRGAQAFSVTHGVLMDAISRQTNRVNIRHQGNVETLIFSGNAGPQSVAFPEVTGD